MKKAFNTKSSIIVIIMALLVVSYYYHLSNKSVSVADKEENIEISAVQDILLKDYSRAYPPSPKEVLKDYLEITKVLHNEELSDNEVELLADKIQELYDEEFIANKSRDAYLMDLKSEIAAFKKNGYAITNYYTSSSTDVDFYSMDGFDFAKLYGTYSVRANNQILSSQNVYLLRKDSDGHWKIYGWMQVEEEE